MITFRFRRAALTVPLAAVAMTLLPVPAQADTCMLDNKGNQVCGASGFRPQASPAPTQALASTTAPPARLARTDARRRPQLRRPGRHPVTSRLRPLLRHRTTRLWLTGTLPPGVTAPGTSGVTASAPPTQTGTKELPPAIPSGASNASGSRASTAAAAATPSSTAAASARATPRPSMTEMAVHTPPPMTTSRTGAAQPSCPSPSRSHIATPIRCQAFLTRPCRAARSAVKES